MFSQLGGQPRRESRTHLDVDIRRGPCSRVVTLVGLSKGGLVKGGDCSRVDDRIGGGEGRRSEERDQLGIHDEVEDALKMEYRMCKEWLVLRWMMRTKMKRMELAAS